MLQLAAAAFAVALQWNELPASLRPADEQSFPTLLGRLDHETSRRVEEGEWDHLVFYLLQGTAFTSLPSIEPAASAKEFAASGRIPSLVEQRFEQLSNSKADSVRIRWARRKIESASRERVFEEYRRAMRFLYEKEWETRKMTGPDRRARIASLYQTRGHSSDTSADSTKAVEAGLSVLRDMRPWNSIRDVLVIGPGSDFAPRTALREESAPRSYQMELLKKLLPAARLECIDVNPRVVESAECAERINILTGRRDKRYDLIVVTNVLVYFSDSELALALANIKAMLAPGGFLLHNELRDEAARGARALGLPVVHARTVRLGGSDDRALFDAAVLHRN